MYFEGVDYLFVTIDSHDSGLQIINFLLWNHHKLLHRK